METIDISPDVTIRYMPVDKSNTNRHEREQTAIRTLVNAAFGTGTSIRHHPTGAPYIAGRNENISISHSSEYAALATAGPSVSIGIDVEKYREQLHRVASRVLSGPELEVYGKSGHLLLKAWTMKEAVYKAALIPGLIFASDINLPLQEEGDTTVTVRGRSFECHFLNIGPDTLICTAVSQT